MISFALALSMALQISADDSVATFTSYVGRERWDFVVRQLDLERAPKWSETDNTPPLNARAAILAGRLFLRQLLKDGDDWRFDAVVLKPVGPRDGSFWVYVIEFSPPLPKPSTVEPTAGSFISSPLAMVILMNGEAIVPIRRAP